MSIMRKFVSKCFMCSSKVIIYNDIFENFLIALISST